MATQFLWNKILANLTPIESRLFPEASSYNQCHVSFDQHVCPLLSLALSIIYDMGVSSHRDVKLFDISYLGFLIPLFFSNLTIVTAHYIFTRLMICPRLDCLVMCLQCVVTTGKLEEKRGRRRHREKMLNSLTPQR